MLVLRQTREHSKYPSPRCRQHQETTTIYGRAYFIGNACGIFCRSNRWSNESQRAIACGSAAPHTLFFCLVCL